MIKDGQAEVVRDGRRLAELGPGDFFGEIGLLVMGRRTASPVALTPMRLIVMFEQSFRRLEKELPTFAAAVRAACLAHPAHVAHGTSNYDHSPRAEVAELADAPDSKSGSPRGVRVRFPPSALIYDRAGGSTTGG